jgi:CheY-like chemotaxis protein
MTKNKVLIVEDEAIIALEIKDRLMKMGYQVCGMASSADKAIKLAEQTSPDLILMDIKLKGKMNGLEASEIIKKRFNIPSIFLTAFMDERPDASADEKKPHYLIKPIIEEELKKAINELLKNSV